MTLYTGLLVCLIASIASVAIDLALYGRLAAYIEHELSLHDPDFSSHRSHPSLIYNEAMAARQQACVRDNSLR